jgi:hypothetical protein
MDFRRALDVSSALLVEAFVQAGANVVEAVERVACLGLPEAAVATSGGDGAPKRTEPSPEDNEASLAELQAMMAGVVKR